MSCHSVVSPMTPNIVLTHGTELYNIPIFVLGTANIIIVNR